MELTNELTAIISVFAMVISMFAILAGFIVAVWRGQAALIHRINERFQVHRDEARADRMEDREETAGLPHRSTHQPQGRPQRTTGLPHRNPRQPQGRPQRTPGVPHRNPRQLQHHEPKHRRQHSRDRALHVNRETDREEARTNRETDREDFRDFRTETRDNHETDREDFRDFRTETRDNFNTTNRNIEKIAEQVGSHAERVATVEGYMSAVSDR